MQIIIFHMSRINDLFDLISDFNTDVMDTFDIQESIKSIGKIGSLQINIHGVCHECEPNDKTISNLKK